MARYHGRKGRVYMSTSGSGTAVPVDSLSEWVLNMATDRVDVTAFGDANKQSVQGLPDISGSFSGFWDDTEDDVWSARDSTDGVKIYLYPSTDAASKYWYGLAWVDFSVNVPVGGAATLSGTFSAAGNWGRR